MNLKELIDNFNQSNKDIYEKIKDIPPVYCKYIQDNFYIDDCENYIPDDSSTPEKYNVVSDVHTEMIIGQLGGWYGDVSIFLPNKIYYLKNKPKIKQYNITLYDDYEEYFTFEVDEGTTLNEAIENEKVNYAHDQNNLRKINNIKNMSKSSHRFLGWYTKHNPNSSKYNFSEPITEDLAIYALYEAVYKLTFWDIPQNEYTVHYSIETTGNKTISTLLTEESNRLQRIILTSNLEAEVKAAENSLAKINQIYDMKKSGYDFLYWYTDTITSVSSGTSFYTLIMKDTDLYARYRVVDTSCKPKQKPKPKPDDDLPKGIDVGIDTSKIIIKNAPDVAEILKTLFTLGGAHFPFNPNRGIDMEQFLFDYNDNAMLQGEIAFLKTAIQNADNRISSVNISANIEDIHVASIDILVKTKDGDYTIINQGVNNENGS